MAQSHSDEAAFTCYAICHPSESMEAHYQSFRLSRGEEASKPLHLWHTNDSSYAVIKCKIAKHVLARQASELIASLRETGRFPLNEPLIVPEAPLEIEDVTTGSLFLAVDKSHTEMSHVGTLLELLVKQPVFDLECLIGHDLVLRQL